MDCIVQNLVATQCPKADLCVSVCSIQRERRDRWTTVFSECASALLVTHTCVQIFILIVLLVSWLDFTQTPASEPWRSLVVRPCLRISNHLLSHALRTENFKWIEMFAGSGAATKAVRGQGYKSAHFDLTDASQYGLNEHGSVFDILSPSGFASLACSR